MPKPKKLVKRDKKNEKQKMASMDLDEPNSSESNPHPRFSGNDRQDSINE
jgi:hypothetical protein